ncbi:MAG: molybdopterin-dependent oxidoreductase [Pirellulales bacterium]|nr:molybdopterin-dependent oxidoreductase [Pirellulales bacterium]
MPLPPGQQLVARDKWPVVGERAPLEPAGVWQVEIAGEVAAPLVYDLSALASLPRTEAIIDIHCVTRWSRPGVHFAGVLLADLLSRAQPTAAARYVSFVAHSARAHSTSLPLDDALRLRTLVSLEADGERLPREHGGPVRVVVPERYFYKSLKWLARIELLEQDRLGYWESDAGYHNTADPWREQRFLASSLSRAEMAALLAARDFSARDLLSLDARGHELTGLAARDALLRNADFRDCVLERANFDGANLSNAHFERAMLRGATFRQADLEGADFRGADLRDADLSGASLIAATFCDELQPPLLRATLDRTTKIDPDQLEALTPVQQEFVRQARRP